MLSPSFRLLKSLENLNEGTLGFSVWRVWLFFRSVFRFFGFCAIKLWFFGFGAHCPFGLQFHFDLSGNCTPPLDSYSHETSVCSTCRHCIGSIRGLITGM